MNLEDTVIEKWFVYCVDDVESLQWETECRFCFSESLIDIILKQWDRSTRQAEDTDSDPQPMDWPEWKDDELLDVVMDFVSNWINAKSAALKHGWNGYTENAPEVFYLWQADQRQPVYGFVLEQDYEMTFILSPREIPDLRPLRAVAVGNGNHEP